MMITVGILIALLLGWSIIDRWTTGTPVLAKLGLAWLIGLGAETVFMFLCDLFSIQFNDIILICISLVVAGIIENKRLLRLFNKSIWKTLFEQLTQIPARSKSLFRISRINTVWVLALLVILLLLGATVSKSLYWPTTAYDSLAGYDLMGKVIAAEGKIHVSLFDTDVQGRRGIYPPLIEGGFAWAYLFGCETPKIIVSLTYLALILVFYALLRRYANPLNAVIFTLFLIISPEMYAHASLSLSNMQAGVYGSLGLIYLFIWMDQEQKSDFWIGSLLMGMNVWARNDGVVLNIAGAAVLLYLAVRRREWKYLLLYTAVAFLPFIAWTLYLKFNIGIVQERFVDHLFWDAARFKRLVIWVRILVFSTNIHGLTFYIFTASLLLNVKRILKNNIELFAMILVAFIMFTAVYYQLDEVKQDSLDSMMRNSFKRGLFYFIPMVLFYASTNHAVRRIFDAVETWRKGREKLQA